MNLLDLLNHWIPMACIVGGIYSAGELTRRRRLGASIPRSRLFNEQNGIEGALVDLFGGSERAVGILEALAHSPAPISLDVLAAKLEGARGAASRADDPAQSAIRVTLGVLLFSRLVIARGGCLAITQLGREVYRRIVGRRFRAGDPVPLPEALNQPVREGYQVGPN